MNRGRMAARNEQRSFDLDLFASSLPEGADYHLFLKDGFPEDRAAAARRADFTAWDQEIDDFSDGAALWSLMDLVITVDSGPAHLAGAIGRPTWILLRYDPDWRWGLNSERTPWYETIKLYRQPARLDWASVVGRVSGDLESFLAELA